MARSIRVEPATAVSTRTTVVIFFLCCCFLSVRSTNAENGNLGYGFYGSTCPRAEEIVKGVVSVRFMFQPTIAAGLIRLLFHDCFIRGCDASVLLDETPSGDPVEKSSPANANSLRGLDVIDNVKSALEKECPGTVSCADIVAFAARDAAVLSGIPSFDVPSGRRDGRVSLAADIPTNLISPEAPLDVITDRFAAKGFSEREMVVLSGAHSIGGAHCMFFNRRLYNFSSDQPQDPSLEPLFAEYLKLKCPKPGSWMSTFSDSERVDFDSENWQSLDGSYYKSLVAGKALLSSDENLMRQKSTRTVVRLMSKHPGLWATEFARAITKLGLLDVKVGDEGEVRTSCRFVK